MAIVQGAHDLEQVSWILYNFIDTAGSSHSQSCYSPQFLDRCIRAQDIESTKSG